MTGTLDPVTLAVIQSGLIQVCNEMDLAFVRAAFSPVIAEALDRSDGIYDRDTGALIAQGDLGLPIFVGTMQFGTAEVIKRARSLAPGDMYIVNDPYLGGTHLMDVRFVKPFFYKGELFSWLANTGHWPDTGGAVPGGFSANATEVEQEGLRLPPVKLFKKGKMDEEILSIILSNIRIADQRIGDIKAQAAALNVGERRLTGLLDRYGRDTVERAIAELRLLAMRPHEVEQIVPQHLDRGPMLRRHLPAPPAEHEVGAEGRVDDRQHVEAVARYRHVAQHGVRDDRYPPLAREQAAHKRLVRTLPAEQPAAGRADAVAGHDVAQQVLDDEDVQPGVPLAHQQLMAAEFEQQPLQLLVLEVGPRLPQRRDRGVIVVAPHHQREGVDADQDVLVRLRWELGERRLLCDDRHVVRLPALAGEQRVGRLRVDAPDLEVDRVLDLELTVPAGHQVDVWYLRDGDADGGREIGHTNSVAPPGASEEFPLPRPH